MSTNRTPESTAQTPLRILLVRLSSMGDIVLSTAAIEAAKKHFGSDTQIEFLTSCGFESLFEGDKRVSSVLSFDRKRGLIDWIRFCSELRQKSYPLILDLHRSHRTRVLRAVFLMDRILGRTRILVVSKHRLASLGLACFKGLWPVSLVPPAWWLRYSEGLLKTPAHPSLKHFTTLTEKRGQGVIGVMPAARWPNKEWGAEPVKSTLLKLLEGAHSKVSKIVVLGTRNDQASQELLKLLQAEPVLRNRVEDFTQNHSLPEVAARISGFDVLFSMDTGLAHIAEAVGTPVVSVFLATQPQAGFGPWRPESVVVRPQLQGEQSSIEEASRAIARHIAHAQVGAGK